MITKTVTITCDSCGSMYTDGGATHVNATDQRKDFGCNGWKRVRGKDVCPTCSSGH